MQPSPRRCFVCENPDRLVHRPAGHAPRGGTQGPGTRRRGDRRRLGARPGGTLRLVLSCVPRSRHAACGLARGGRPRLLVSLGQGAVTAPVTAAAVPPVRAAHAPDEGSRDVIIAVDAGHGGDDPGAIGHGGTHEKEVTLAIARALAARIDRRAGHARGADARPRRVRPAARPHAPGARCARRHVRLDPRRCGADRSISGASVYVLSEHGASSEAARLLAERENAADLKGGVSLSTASRSLAPVLLDAGAERQIIGVRASRPRTGW